MAAISEQEFSVRGNPTAFLSVGKSLDENPEKLILIIPGNPGIVTFYKEFAQYLYEGLGETYSIWVVCHTGHSCTSDLAFWPNNRHVYDLDDQVQHKISFITDYVPKGCEVMLIGHSIGGYITLKIMKAFETNSDVNINMSYLLFPSIERMKATPNGKVLWPMFAYFRWFMILLALFLYTFPLALKRMLMGVYFTGKKISKCCVEGCMELLHPKIIQNILWMAYHELSTVNAADLETIEKHKDRLVLYYGPTDGWGPKSYRSEMLEKVDGLKSYLCEDDYPHAFVLNKAKGMADKIINWIGS